MMVRKTKPKEYLKQSVGFALDLENLSNLDTFIAEKDSLIECIYECDGKAWRIGKIV